jgi:hypothetical protein
MSLLHGRVL